MSLLRNLTTAIPLVLPLALAASPAWAASTIPLPEPSSAFLMALGMAGVLIGRRLSTKTPKE